MRAAYPLRHADGSRGRHDAFCQFAAFAEMPTPALREPATGARLMRGGFGRGRCQASEISAAMSARFNTLSLSAVAQLE